MTDRIEKTIELKAPVSRVWRALTDHREFGTWFRVQLDGPFVPGQVSRGHITYPGYEHVALGGRGRRRWSPSGCSPSPGIPMPSIRTRTIPASRRRWSSSRCRRPRRGTLLRVVESGFDKLPGQAPRRGVPHERGRLERADEEHRAAMSDKRPSQAAR